MGSSFCEKTLDFLRGGWYSIKTMKLDHTYTVTIENFAFGNIDTNVLIALFRDGRTCAPFIQQHLPIWFDTLKYVDETGYDHVSGERKFEHKSFTKGGCIFAPSNMVGSGRKINEAVVKQHIEDTKLTYIITDITEFPTIRIRFVDGNKLINKYPKCKINSGDKKSFFELTV